MDRRHKQGKTRREAIYHRGVGTPDDPDPAARLAAIHATTGSADDFFEPGYLNALREDWPD